MNKKLVALAVAGVFAAPAIAFAQASNVQIYGRANLGLDNYQANGASLQPAGSGDVNSFKSRNRIFDNSSRIGLRGTEDLGNGLRAVFLIESGVNMDSGNGQGQSGAWNTSAGFLGSRVNHIGLEGNWGLLTFGRSNIWWVNYAQEQVGANYVNASVPWTSGTQGRGMSSPVNRQSNVLQYTTPTWSGFNAVISYSPNSEGANNGVPACPAGTNLIINSTGLAAQCAVTGATAGTTLTTANVAGAGTNVPSNIIASTAQTQQANTDARIWGITINGGWGPIAGGYDWVNSKSATNIINPTNVAAGVAPTQQYTNNKFRIGWTYMPGGQVSLVWTSIKVDNPSAANAQFVQTATAAAPVTLKQTAWALNWEHIFGNIQALAQYGKVSNITGCTTAQAAGDVNPVAGGRCDNTGATGYMLGVRYLMSKRTAAYVTYNAINNDSRYNADYSAASYTSASTGATANTAALQGPGGPGVGLPPGSVGADPRVWAVGIIHNF